MKTTRLCVLFPLCVLGTALWLAAAAPAVTGLIRQVNGEILLTTAADTGSFYRIETSSDFTQWTPLVTVQSTGTGQLLDTAAPQLNRRFYRATPLTGTGIITGDHLQTADGDALLHPIGHASVMVSWNGKIIYSDPSDQNSNGPRFAGLPQADVIVITHTHSDHFDTSTGNARLNALLKTGTVIFAPQAVYNAMPSAAPATLRGRTTVLANNATGTAHGMTVKAIGMYNIPPGPIGHAQGVGNGYVITLGGKNLYFSGDSEDIPEMRALTNIDAAFVCMSEPSNMTVDAAASAVRAFRPKIVFPYHYTQAPTTFDTARFKDLVGTDLGIEVRRRAFY
jgi:L-ascorbate metabolism protein UlaG (beta-lactamase superfamily)